MTKLKPGDIFSKCCDCGKWFRRGTIIMDPYDGQWRCERCSRKLREGLDESCNPTLKRLLSSQIEKDSKIREGKENGRI